MRVCSLPELNLPEKHARFIRFYLENILKESYVDKVILFGSCAKGNASFDSDIDLFIVTTTGLSDDSDEIYNLMYKSTETMPLSDYVSCDILIASAEDVQHKSTPLIRTILREGVELHGIH